MENITRLPALPLIVNDPYLSLWCAGDRLTDADTTHWTGSVKRIRGEITIDGAKLRFLGLGENPAMATKSIRVTPTCTEAVYEALGVRLALRFTTPLLLDDLDLFSTPISFVDHVVSSVDGGRHTVSVTLNVFDDLCYDGDARPQMFCDTFDENGLRVAYTGQKRQKILCHSGDHITIDWGYLYLAARAEVEIGEGCMLARADGMAFPGGDVTLNALVGYDDVASVNYFGAPTKAWCFRNGCTVIDALHSFDAGRECIMERCRAFDEKLMREAEERGGADYALIVCAAYRHAIGAHKLIADENGEAVLLSKENDSNGCVGTVDLSYPSSPLFLKYNPELVRAMARPVLRFAGTPVWTYDFAPHDVGRYPYATGQVYGLRRRDGVRVEEGDVFPPYYLYPATAACYEHRYQMPVEECGNMLVMLRAAEMADGDMSFTQKHLPLLAKWAGYLLEYGDDPGEQLCTDDFAGHLAHNANLSAKALVGVRCFADSLKALGDMRWVQYKDKAAQMARKWIERAGENGATPLTLSGEGWSMKYNLAWDAALGLDIFPESFYEKEIASYLPRVNDYGLPLDSRKDYTKSDWILWTASMTRDRAAFARLVAPVARFLRETPSRVPFSDWYDTKTGKFQSFIARSVQGGVFMPLLSLTAREAK